LGPWGNRKKERLYRRKRSKAGWASWVILGRTSWKMGGGPLAGKNNHSRELTRNRETEPQGRRMARSTMNQKEDRVRTKAEGEGKRPSVRKGHNGGVLLKRWLKNAI